MAQISMKQLADMAGLDASTVSRALRGDTKRVAAATIERVQRLAKELGYVADPVAATLRSGRSRMLGVLVYSLTDIVMGHLVTAIDEASQELGYLSIVVATQGSSEARLRVIDQLLGRRVDGLILCESQVGDDIPPQLRAGDVPYVFAMRAGAGAVSVTADDEAGGALVADHFLEEGHDTIAVVPGPRHIRTAIDRISGFTSVLAGQRNVKLLPPGVHAGFGVDNGYQSTVKLLRRRGRPSAIFCVNDHAAIGAGRAIVEAGLRIGSDVALVGYNDIPQAAYLETPLSSVRTDVRLMGRTAAQQLIALVDGGEASSSRLTPTLIKRSSSDLRAAAARPARQA
ncbi:LacI family DNA-binding transcriptional regulator [Streptomyces fuscichromogenes]|uniref:LacI family DNA-binding transcriptional regulator n=1 Tax=Streptomyces fuscichromogenes TaxID=1324013 RepID=UPI00382852AD